MSYFSSNLFNYSVLHINIDYILVGIIANISDYKSADFLIQQCVRLENKVFLIEKLRWHSRMVAVHFFLP